MNILKLIKTRSLNMRLFLLTSIPMLVVLVLLGLNINFFLSSSSYGSKSSSSDKNQKIFLLENLSVMESSLNGLSRKLLFISQGEADSLSADDFKNAEEDFKQFKKGQENYLHFKHSQKEADLFKTVSENWGTVDGIVSTIFDKFSKLNLKNKEEKEGFLNRIKSVVGPLMMSFDAISTTLQGISKNRQIEMNLELEAETAKSKQFSFISIAIGLVGVVVSIIASLLIYRKTKSELLDISHALSDGAGNVLSASEKVIDSSQNVSSASGVQATALQQTASAITQINSMIQNNSTFASETMSISKMSRNASEKGKENIQNMISSIHEIDSTNREVTEQMDSTNKQLIEITSLIDEIKNKTKVIDDIVFQTKLLSFNASVEAARAGEQGKGFAVVAEEIGNLANMSGEAAKVIAELLSTSIQNVEKIVAESKNRVNDLSSESKLTIQKGSEMASMCQQSFEEISLNIAKVDNLISQIFLASKEQSLGVEEVTKSIQQMEVTLNDNMSMATVTTSVAEDLKTESQKLEKIVDDLVYILEGISKTGGKCV